jgi:hypothetical protein
LHKNEGKVANFTRFDYFSAIIFQP